MPIASLSGRPLLDTTPDSRLFVDRDVELDCATRAVEAGLNTVVFGARGMGKTSFLRHLLWLLRKQSTGTSVTGPAVYLNASSVQEPTELLAVMGDRLKGQLVERTDQTFHPAWPQPGRLLRELDRIREDLERQDKGRPGRARRAVLLDNAVVPIARTLFGQLRDELWALPVTWVVAADQEHRAVILQVPVDAFFEQHVDLGPLGPQEASQLLRRRVSAAVMPNDVVKRVVGMAGGNPRKLVAVAREVVEHGPAVIEAQERLDRQFDTVLASLGRSASMLVAEVRARGGSVSASDPALLASLGWTRARASQVFQQLAQAGLVTEQEDVSGGPGRPKKLYGLISSPGAQV